MKWKNHRRVTTAVVFSLTGHLLPVLFARWGSVFPDSIEGEGFLSEDPRERRKWHKNHRKESHLLILYLIPAVLVYAFLKVFVIPLTLSELYDIAISHDYMKILGLFAYFAMWFLIGCLCHLAEDFFCGGIPIINPKRRWGIRLFYVNEDPVKENVIAFFVIVLAIFARWYFAERFYLGL